MQVIAERISDHQGTERPLAVILPKVELVEATDVPDDPGEADGQGSRADASEEIRSLEEQFSLPSVDRGDVDLNSTSEKPAEPPVNAISKMFAEGRRQPGFEEARSLMVEDANNFLQEVLKIKAEKGDLDIQGGVSYVIADKPIITETNL